MKKLIVLLGIISIATAAATILVGCTEYNCFSKNENCEEGDNEEVKKKGKR